MQVFKTKQIFPINIFRNCFHTQRHDLWSTRSNSAHSCSNRPSLLSVKWRVYSLRVTAHWLRDVASTTPFSPALQRNMASHQHRWWFGGPYKKDRPWYQNQAIRHELHKTQTFLIFRSAQMRWCNWTGWTMITDSALIHCPCLEKRFWKKWS